jgi:hypothetical protein
MISLIICRQLFQTSLCDLFMEFDFFKNFKVRIKPIQVAIFVKKKLIKKIFFT